MIPREKLDGVFQTAIKACRERTVKHVTLPETERFTVEYVTNKSWSGYNWYQGDFRSLIQVNTDLPIYIDRAIDLACHEGYPGHHVYNALLEKHLVRDRGWVEFTVYPLFSPQSLIAEGTANYGIEVAFPGRERVDLERSVLFPAAGLDPSRAAEYYEVQGLVDQLAYAGNEAARRYLDGKMSAADAAAYLEKYAMYSPRAREAARSIHRSVSQLRDQLQPGQGHGSAVHRVTRRHSSESGEAMGGIRNSSCRRHGCPPDCSDRRQLMSRRVLLAATILLVAGYVSVYATGRTSPPIRSDGYSYYVYLPSWFLYGDSTLEAVARDCCGGEFPFFTAIIRWPVTERWVNAHPIGVAILQTPFFLIGHALDEMEQPLARRLYLLLSACRRHIRHMVGDCRPVGPPTRARPPLQRWRDRRDTGRTAPRHRPLPLRDLRQLVQPCVLVLSPYCLAVADRAMA